MKKPSLARLRSAALAILPIALAACPQYMEAQAQATVQRTLDLSVFGGITGTLVRMPDRGGKNAGITVGVDLGFRPFFGFRPKAEVRGTYPVKDGIVAEERDILGGIRVDRPLPKLLGGRFTPFGDFLAGRGQLNYGRLGGLNDTHTLFYSESPSPVYSPGAGFDFELTRYLALHGDAQIQHWSSPVPASGHMWSLPVTAAVVYRFGRTRNPGYVRGH